MLDKMALGEISTKVKVKYGNARCKHESWESLDFYIHQELGKRCESEFIDFLRSRYRPSLKGEQYMTDTELAEKLKLNKRTLLEYRNTGKIPYYQIGGKILYRESDIESLLSKNRREAFK